MLFQFLRHQLEAPRPTIASTVRRANENGHVDLGAGLRLQVVDEASGGPPRPVITVSKSGS